MQQGFDQQSVKWALAAVRSKRCKRSQDAMSESVVGAVNVCLHGIHRSFRTALVLRKTDTDVFGSEQEREDLDRTRPFRLVPGILRHKYRLAADRTNSGWLPSLRHFHHMRSRDRNVETWKMRHVCENRWRRAVF